MTYTLSSGSWIIRDADSASIPADDANIDWRQYQQWLAEGNTPNPYIPPSAPSEPTITEKLASVGLTVEDLKAALGLN